MPKVEICFGTVFESSTKVDKKPKTMVITAIYDTDDWGARRYYPDSGIIDPWSPGSTAPKHIGHITDKRLSYEEVIDGMTKGSDGIPISEKIIDLLKEHSKKDPITITLPDD